MSKSVLKIFTKYSYLLLLIFTFQTSFASVNPEYKLEKKYYSICLNRMQTFVENDGWWVLMKSSGIGWNEVGCDPEKYVPEVFQKHLPEKEITQNIKVKEVSADMLWIFIPK